MGKYDHWAIERDRSSFRYADKTLTSPVTIPLALDPTKIVETPLPLAKGEPDETLEELCARIEAQDGRTAFAGEMISKAVAKKHGIPWVEFVSDRRTLHVARARQEAMYLMKTHTHLSLPQIGRILGNRDHTTILHGVRVYMERNGLAK